MAPNLPTLPQILPAQHPPAPRMGPGQRPTEPSRFRDTLDGIERPSQESATLPVEPSDRPLSDRDPSDDPLAAPQSANPEARNDQRLGAGDGSAPSDSNSSDAGDSTAEAVGSAVDGVATGTASDQTDAQASAASEAIARAIGGAGAQIAARSVQQANGAAVANIGPAASTAVATLDPAARPDAAGPIQLGGTDIEGAVGQVDRASTSASTTANKAQEQSAATAAADRNAFAKGNGAKDVRAADPLARLVEGGRALQQETSDTQRDAVLARLDEVEASIARSRVEQAVRGGATVTVEATSQGSVQPKARTGAAEARTSADQQTAAVAADARESRVGDQASAGSATAPVTPQQGPRMPGQSGAAIDALAADPAATDAAAPNADEAAAHPGAQLAAKGVALLANQRGGAITMRLEPPALGQLRIELNINQGAVTADFTAATPEARTLLEANLGMLRERLESQGLSVERISVHGARGTESAAPVSAHAADQRQEGADARNDRGDRQDRSGSRQDAAGGESRGRRDGDSRGNRDRNDAARQGNGRGFAAALSGVTAQRTDPMRRAG